MKLSFVFLLSLVYTLGACQSTPISKEKSRTYAIQKTDAEWKEILTDEQFHIHHGQEI